MSDLARVAFEAWQDARGVPAGDDGDHGWSMAPAEMVQRWQATADAIEAHLVESHPLLADARAMAVSIIRDAEIRAARPRTELLAEMDRRITDLRLFEREYRARLHAYVQHHLDELNADAREEEPV